MTNRPTTAMLLALMAFRQLSDKAEIRARLQAEAALHIYELGDLDDFFWPDTRYLAGEGDATLLLYTGASVPTLLAFTSSYERELSELVEESIPTLPDRLYAHVSSSLLPLLRQHYRIESQSAHQKMQLLAPAWMGTASGEAGCDWLGPDDLQEVQSFYREAYPGNWFEPRMLETSMYGGIRVQGQLSALAGVHVYSALERVAALGNIATLVQARGQGLARRCTSELCTRLFAQVDRIGLNVRSDNLPAIACYTGLGFQHVAPYVELGLCRL